MEAKASLYLVADASTRKVTSGRKSRKAIAGEDRPIRVIDTSCRKRHSVMPPYGVRGLKFHKHDAYSSTPTKGSSTMTELQI
jgi:hypothetical protein